MICNELIKRDLPKLRSREEMVEIMQREVFGYLPCIDYEISVSPFVGIENRLCANQVSMSRADFTIKTERGSHTFPIYRIAHKDGKKRPLIIYDDIHREKPSVYVPVEELAEYDVDYLMFCYKDISSDDGDFSTGLAPILLPNGKDTPTTCGKIGIWAWASMRVVDYALTLGSTDENNIMIAGHSRLGKTALVTGMLDERIKFVYSNMAGCAGDSLAHGSIGLLANGEPYGTRGRGENIHDIVNMFPYWFCENYKKYAEKMYSDEFDQHFLLATVCPRYVLIGSADMDDWADQYSQQMCCIAASEAWEKKGLNGFVGTDERAKGGDAFIDGQVGFFMIHHMHYMSRHCWKVAVEFIEKHKN